MAIFNQKLKKEFTKKIVDPALEVATQTLITESMELIPFSTGLLRHSQEARDAKNGQIRITSDVHYADYQYNVKLHHVENVGVYEALTDYFPGDSYNVAWHKAQTNPPNAWKPSVALWIQRTIDNKKKYANIKEVFKNEIIKRINETKNNNNR